jgi:HlyD family secretion protein
MGRLQRLWIGKKPTVFVVSVVLAAFVVFGAFRLVNLAPRVPSAVVQRGEFVDYLELRGNAKALKSVTITAPYDAGQPQILKLAPTGAQVRKGDVIVEFDTTTLEQTLAQAESELKSADAEIEQSRAQARLKEEQDLTDLMKARYDVDAAKLEASKQEIVSKIEGEEAQLKLDDAEQKLKETEVKLNSDKTSDAADIQSKRQEHDQAQFKVRQTERSLSVLKLKTPIDGMVTLLVNMRASGFFASGASFKQGDRAWPGAAIAELPDLSTLQILARVDETERGRIQVGQPITVRVDAIPDREFSGHISQISTSASIDFTAGWPFPRNFTAQISLDDHDPRLRPGMQANLRVATTRVANAITIPSQAQFHDAGQSVAYVLRGGKFVERPIDVARRSGDRLLIDKGLEVGERVALRDPTAAP